jgi:putative phage-type endonuclease
MPQEEIQLVDYETRERWLAARSSGIGASESAALFDASPWHTLMSLWALKVGKVDGDLGDAEYLTWGTLLEEPIAKRYEQKTGRRVWQGGQFAVAQHPSLPFMRATPDRWVIDAPDRGTPGLLQIKNTNAFRGHDWDDGVPQHIEIQVQHEMAVTGRDWASVAVLVGGCEFRSFDVERNPAFIEELEASCAWFWDFVTRREQPPIDGSLRTLEALKRLHPKDSGEQIMLPEDAIGWLAAFEAAKADAKAAEANKTDAENRLRDAIGDASYALLPDGRRLTLLTTERKGYQPNYVDPTTYRVLRLEGAKKGKRR